MNTDIDPSVDMSMNTDTSTSNKDSDSGSGNGKGEVIGLKIWSELISWAESLAKDDPEAFNGLRSLTPMNEPAHLAAKYGEGGEYEPFLPPLDPDVASSYISELAARRHNSDGVPDLAFPNFPMPDGPHLRVLLWLDRAVDAFRSSSLPSKGVQLFINVIESIFSSSVLPVGDAGDTTLLNSGELIALWWSAITSPSERSSWAVLDVHHYHAWDPSCSGSPDGPVPSTSSTFSSSYICGDAASRDITLSRCTKWAEIFRNTVDRFCGGMSKLASTEFSAATNHETRKQCQDISTLRATFQEQIKKARAADVELAFWSYRMPYGSAEMRPAWSFRHLLYLMGVLPFPDLPVHKCGGSVGTSR